MTAITQAQTMTELIERVSALLDIPIEGEDGIPKESQVIQWLNDGMLLLCKILPEEQMAWAQHETVHDNVGAELYLEGDNIFRLVSVSKFGFQCTEVPLSRLRSMTSRQPRLASVMSPYMARFGREGKVRLVFKPESAGKVLASFIRMPTAYATGWTPDPYSAPAELEEMIVEYAVIQGKIQDEAPDQVQLLLQAWMQKVGVEQQSVTTGVEE